MVQMISRAAVFGDGIAPRSTNGSPRPKLTLPLDTLVVHDVGAGRWRNRDAATAVRSIQAWAESPEKGTPWEYNYAVHDDGSIVEYAGTYQAAHCLGYNSVTIGVVYLCGGISEGIITDDAIQTYAYLVRMLKRDGVLSPDAAIKRHSDLAIGTTHTLCPTSVSPRWTDLLTAIQHNEEEHTAMVRYRDIRYTNVWLVGAGPAINLSGLLDQHYARLGVPLVEDTHDVMLRSLMYQSGLTAGDLVRR